MWLVGIALLVAVGLSYFFMFWYAAKGHDDAFPVYLFAGAALVCALFWGGLLARIV
jgi:hypothetical protein